MNAIKSAQKRKRGMVLLVVVSLLALFILMGVTFALVAMNYQRSARSNLQIKRVGDPPETETDLVLGQVLYDTLTNTSLRGNSLLYDLYGSDSVAGEVVGVLGGMDTQSGTPGQYQLIKFSCAPAGFSQLPHYYSGRVITFTSGQAANHSTRVVASALNTNSGLYEFAIEAIDSKSARFVVPAAGDDFRINGAPFNGAGSGYDPTTRTVDASYAAPNGAGGYYTPYPISLLPHHAAYDSVAGTAYFGTGASQSPQSTGIATIGAGGLDEPWDAPDLQNLFLAMYPPRAAESYSTNNPIPIIPSFHRPELINFWVNFMATTGSSDPRSPLNPAVPALTFHQQATYQPHRDFLRSIIFRPMPWDHPNFSGSNPVFDPSLSPQQLIANLINQGNGRFWDVDNDNDGVPDSIWVDPGLPIVTTPDGRRYKRLAAILIRDLDGSIDLNAHGNLQQVNATNRVATAIQGGVMTASMNLPRGLGFGPAEVDFLHLFNGDNQAYRDVMEFRYSSSQSGDLQPGSPNTRDGLSAVKHFGVPTNYAQLGPPGTGFGAPSWYASPPDVWGRGAVVLDYGGQPLFGNMGLANETVDSPYELSLSGQPNNADSPFAPVELERLLRYHDQDARQLPCRLITPGITNRYFSTEVPGQIGASHHLRNMVTAMSSDVPAHVTQIPQEMRTNSNLSPNLPGIGSATIIDLYRARLMAPVAAGGGGMTSPSPQLTATLNQIVPWEFFHGKKFDINRWLGNGIDSDNNGARDDANEANNEVPWQTSAVDTTLAANLPNYFRNPAVTGNPHNGMDVNGDGNVNGIDASMARQLYARHLFCMAMLFVPTNYAPSMCPQENTLAPNDYQKLIARRIAQWAINCVEFRDTDSIMTPFEFDYSPFKDDDGNAANGTWEVDGHVGYSPGPDNQLYTNDDIQSPDDGQSFRGLVWGMEYPDLMLTETIAFHDRRVKDTDHDPSTKKREETAAPNDEDLDQFRTPQGSLFVELYCPRAYPWMNNWSQKPIAPNDLYDANGRLRLGKVEPTTNTWPVWRLAFAPLEKTVDARHPTRMYASNRESASFETLPHNVSLVLPNNNPAQAISPDRFAYFAPLPMTSPDRDKSFISTLNNLVVEPGQYVVVGPRQTTYLGSQDPGNTPMPAPPITGWGGNSRQYVQITAGSGNAGNCVVHDITGTAPTLAAGAGIRAPVGVICQMPGPMTWTNPVQVGLNLTEPLPTSAAYYPEPMPMPMLPAGVPTDFYDNPQTPQNTFPDVPFESTAGVSSAGPIVAQQMIKSGTYTDCSGAFLQRLANPSLPYNPLPPDPNYNSSYPVNPYITIDWSTIDATVFSGEEDSSRQIMPTPTANMEAIDPDDPTPNTNPQILFRTRQRGFMPVASTPTANPWPPFPTANTMPTGVATAASHYFKYSLSNDDTATAASTYDVNLDRHTLGWLNGTVDQVQVTPTAYEGEPRNPFPWLAWNNRPFSNPMELLMVPSSSPSRFGAEITPGFQFPAASGIYAHDAADPAVLRAPFGHLLNFFQTANPNSGGPSPQMAPHFYRLLDFVEVPSPYQGAERWYNPQHFANAGIYLPPFNRFSRFRDPGKVNINTIFDADVWSAVVGLHPHLNTNAMWNKVTQSRSGISGAPSANGWLQMNVASPTRFGNPFRTADSADLMPPVPTMRKLNPAEATFLRPDPDPAANNKPLFQPDPNSEWQEPFRDVRRNPYFLNSDLQKIGNVFTTRSNCYAIWITIGYFEAEEWRPGTAANPPVVYDSAHPDGFALGQEIGADSGSPTRHRAFYMIDRSIPVGFIPGSRLNTDDCVLIRRLIE